MKTGTFVFSLSVLSTLTAALPAPKAGPAIENSNTKRFVPTIIQYKDYTEDTSNDNSKRFIPPIIQYKDYTEDESDDKSKRFVPTIIPYKDYAEDASDEKA
ncbi:hypothetical protein BOTCAL_0032g00060 [Botryotinia calthae]|uniref:Uncharacterized protein n=1 Tax=Botryotinia calthae TaxID=38488 RepID=A0A4Y8DFS8_9HELO|nr:hypothetical protein BOTCAL_0032g00060 [Botryotinia calthae]